MRPHRSSTIWGEFSRFRLFCAMLVNVYHDYETLSRHAADEILQQAQRKPDSVLCLAAGATPRLTYERHTARVAQEERDFSRWTSVGLVDWITVSPDNDRSCAWFFLTFLFKPLSLAASKIHMFDALYPVLQAECDKMNETIRKN